MISGLFELLFEIIRCIWNAPTWTVILGIVIYAVLYFIGNLFFIFDSSGESGGGGGSDTDGSGEPLRIDFDKPEHSFVFYDNHGNRCGRGSSFYDSKGERCSWGSGFHDGKGYYRQWGENYYDARGYFRSWGECFYDAQGNLVYPNG